MARTPQQIVQATLEAARSQLVRTVLQSEAEIDAAWAPVLEQLRQQLATAQPSEVQGLVSDALRSMAESAIGITSQSIAQGASQGASAATATHEGLTGPGGPMPELAGRTVGIGASREAQIAAARIAGETTPDRLNLSARMYEQLGEVATEGARVVRSSIQARASLFDTAEAFLAANRERMVVQLPQYAADLQAAARIAIDTGDRRALEQSIATHTRSLDRLGLGRGRTDGLSSLRAASRQFVYDLRRATPQNIDRVVSRYIEDRAQFAAQRIARHETAEAYRQANLETQQTQPYVVGMRWTLSPAHPRADVCDLFANQDLYRMGPGGYPADKVPETPHPNCIPAGHLIETSDGPVPIERIAVGMRVRTHTGAMRQVLRLSARHYVGELVVATVGERQLVTTPEHPVLTTRGWVIADRIQPGERVFLRRDTNDAPAEPREVGVLDGVHATLSRGLVPVTGINLNGDLLGDEPEVDIVPAEGHLRNGFESRAAERDHHAALVLGEHPGPLACGGTAEQLDERAPGATNGSMSGNSHRRSSLGASTGTRDQLLLARGPLRDARMEQSVIDGDPCETQPPRDLEDTQALLDVEAHDILSGDVGALQAVRECLLSGHFVLALVGAVAREQHDGGVFNFAVDTDESYCVSGIVTHNCLCMHLSIIDEDFFERQLAQMDGTPEPPRGWESERTQTADEWLAKQPEAFQQQLLGPTRAAIFANPNDNRPVIDTQGRPIPVREVLASPEAGRSSGRRDERVGPAGPTGWHSDLMDRAFNAAGIPPVDRSTLATIGEPGRHGSTSSFDPTSREIVLRPGLHLEHPDTQLLEALHEVVHAQQFSDVLKRHAGDVAAALGEYQVDRRSLRYAQDEVDAESRARSMAEAAVGGRLDAGTVISSFKYQRRYERRVAKLLRGRE